MKSSTHTWKSVNIDGSQIVDEESFHRELKFKMGFSDNYWMTFDSLFDHLLSLSTEGISKYFKIAKNEEIVFKIQDAEKLINCDIGLFTRFLKTITDVNAYYKRSKNHTRVLLELL
jgi:RNAse (barnase) inhibitor barstar